MFLNCKARSKSRKPAKANRTMKWVACAKIPRTDSLKDSSA